MSPNLFSTKKAIFIAKKDGSSLDDLCTENFKWFHMYLWIESDKLGIFFPQLRNAQGIQPAKHLDFLLVNLADFDCLMISQIWDM